MRTKARSSFRQFSTRFGSAHLLASSGCIARSSNHPTSRQTFTSAIQNARPSFFFVRTNQTTTADPTPSTNTTAENTSTQQTIRPPRKGPYMSKIVPKVERGSRKEILDAIQELQLRKGTTQIIWPSEVTTLLQKSDGRRDLQKVILDLVPFVGGKNIYHLTTLLSVLGTMGHIDSAFMLYQQILRRGLQPNVVTFTALLNACAKVGDVGRAFGVLQQMKEQNVAPNEITFVNLMSACAQVADVEKGLGLLEKMKEYNLAPPLPVFNTLLNACTPKGEVERAFEILNLMRARGVEPDALSYTILIKAYRMRADVKGAIRVLDLMAQQKVQPLPYTFVALMTCLDDVDKACEVFDRMAAHNCVPNDFVYRALIDLCIRKQALKKAVELFERMVKEGTVPSRRVFNMITAAHVRSGDAAKAFGMYQLMEEKEVTPDIVTFNSMLSACELTGDLDSASLVLKELKARDLVPDAVTYTTYAKVCNKRGNLPAAFAGLDFMLEMGLPLTDSIFFYLGRFCLTKEDKRFAGRLLDIWRGNKEAFQQVKETHTATVRALETLSSPES